MKNNVASRAVVRQVVRSAIGNPDRNIPAVLGLLEAVDRKGVNAKTYKYSNVNIKEVSLLDALRSPLFMEYRRNQPFNANMLRPCPAVLFLALPGEEQHYVIRVGTEDFSFDGMTFLMVPATLGQLEEVARLSRRKDDLEENYNKLSGSLDTLLDSLEGVSGSLLDAAGGLDALNAARGTVSSGKGAVYNRADALRQDLDHINAALAPVSGDLGNASEALEDTKSALETLNGDVQELKNQLAEVMLARGAVISAIVSIFVLPALLCVFEPLFRVTSLNWRGKPCHRKGGVPCAMLDKGVCGG